MPAPYFINGGDEVVSLAPNQSVSISEPLVLEAGTATIGKVELTGPQLTPVDSTISTDGSVEAGKRKIEFIFASDFVGTVNGIARTGDVDSYRKYEAPPGHTLSAIPYTISAGSADLTTY